jgi:hypothetical protein
MWTSTKLAAVQPPSLRMHYANWLPMAEANGVFEANPDLIRSKVYGFLIPNMTTKKVSIVLSEFVRVNLIALHHVDGKTWGYFNGIHKPGRLPTDGHLTRYKNLPPDHPDASVPDCPGQSRTSPEGFGSGLVLDCIGSGLEEQEAMKLKTKIADKAREVLGTAISLGDRTWPEITALARVYGQSEVFDAFTDWAVTRVGEPCYFPLSEFLKIADGVLRHETVLTASPEAGAVIGEITFISQGKVIPNAKQAFIITRWLNDFTASEIIAAFRAFYDQLNLEDSFQMKFAARDFSEKGTHLVELARRNKQLAIEQESMRERQRQEMDRQSAELGVETARLIAEQEDGVIEEDFNHV